MKITKPDIIVIAALILTSLFFIIDKDDGYKKLYLINNNHKELIQMHEQRISLHDGDVILEVTGEGARFLESDCPNHICINQGWVDRCGEAAVCVPNKLALVMECSEVEYDAVSE